MARHGFVLAGDTAQSLLVCAIGPSLAAFGVTNPVRNPALKVVSTAGAVVAENDDWGSDNVDAINRLDTLAGAFALPNGSKEAIVFLRAPAGAYVVEARSSEQADAGEMLIEVFMLP